MPGKYFVNTCCSVEIWRNILNAPRFIESLLFTIENFFGKKFGRRRFGKFSLWLCVSQGVSDVDSSLSWGWFCREILTG